MYGHDPLLIALLLILGGLGIGCVQYRWPTIGAAIDVATKVLITFIGMLIFASGGATGRGTPAEPVPAPPTSVTSSPTPATTSSEPARAPLQDPRQSQAEGAPL
jgi:hypothetical protein